MFTDIVCSHCIACCLVPPCMCIIVLAVATLTFCIHCMCVLAVATLTFCIHCMCVLYVVLHWCVHLLMALLIGGHIFVGG